MPRTGEQAAGKNVRNLPRFSAWALSVVENPYTARKRSSRTVPQ
jgi:hypothetical protein